MFCLNQMMKEKRHNEIIGHGNGISSTLYVLFFDIDIICVDQLYAVLHIIIPLGTYSSEYLAIPFLLCN